MIPSLIAIQPDSHFSIYNLPYGVFSPTYGAKPRVGVAIGDWVLDLSILESAGIFSSFWLYEESVFSQPSLNPFMTLGHLQWQSARQAIQNLLRADLPNAENRQQLIQQAIYPLSQVQLHLPVQIGDYTDFYSSREHATNVGTMFRGKENALMPNWLHLPIAYHGRSSSIVLSDTEIVRPKGQIKPADSPNPIFAPTRLLDFELEMGFFIGTGNSLGKPTSVNQAEDHIFGFVLVNDWSARDIQQWEYQPLGPFLAKNFATSISPWVVTLEALQPFRTAAPVQNPEPLPYLQMTDRYTFDIQLEVQLQTAQMDSPMTISRSNYRYLYWNMCQQLAHHTITGCNLRTGDLLASGTISGPTDDSLGSLLELSWRGSRPIALPSGETRSFLQDGDRLILSGWCQGDGYRVGFGEVAGTVVPAT